MNLLRPSTWFPVKTLPIQINPNSADLLARHLGRLSNLFAALEIARDQRAILSEIKQRQTAVEQYGHAAPRTEQEARDLLAKVKG